MKREDVAFAITNEILARLNDLHELAGSEEYATAAWRLAHLATAFLYQAVADAEGEGPKTWHLQGPMIEAALNVARGGSPTNPGDAANLRAVAHCIESAARYQVLTEAGREGQRSYFDAVRGDLALIDPKFKNLSHEQLLRVVTEFQQAKTDVMRRKVDAVTNLCRCSGINACNLKRPQPGRDLGKEKVSDALNYESTRKKK